MPTISLPDSSSPAARLAAVLGGARRSGGGWVCRCCAHEDHAPSLSLRDGADGKLLMFCHAGCSFRDITAELKRRGLTGAHEQSRSAAWRPPGDDTGQRRDLARWIWRQRRPVKGTPAERYLRIHRGYCGDLPATLGYLPERHDHAHALVAAFGLAGELEPGVLMMRDDDVQGIQLIRLGADARKLRDGSNPMTIGRCMGVPVMLAPINDLLGLAITEGIEDALSIHAATGLGAWAAGGASRLAALAGSVPSYVDCVTVVADADPAGEFGSRALFDSLRHRGFGDLRMGIV